MVAEISLYFLSAVTIGCLWPILWYWLGYSAKITVSILFALDAVVTIEAALYSNISVYLAERKIDLIINIPSSMALEKFADMQEDDYKIRRKAVELGIPVLTNVENIDVFIKGLAWLRSREITIMPLSSKV